MERVGDFVRRALQRGLLRLGVSWPPVVEWTPKAISASVSRGDLVIPQECASGGVDYVRGWHLDRAPEWWKPTTREWALELTGRLARRLGSMHEFFRETDGTGRLHVRVWKDPDFDGRYRTEPVAGGRTANLVLEPAWYLDRTRGRENAILWRMSGGPATITEALKAGWARIVDGEPSQPEAPGRRGGKAIGRSENIPA